MDRLQHIRTTRRHFLRHSAQATGLATAIAWPTAHAALTPRLGAAERVRLAFMGVNDRGKQLIARFVRDPRVEIAYICDPDAAAIAPAVKIATDDGRRVPKVVADFRRALDDPSVDAMVCAAPDHWHALATILACQAAKDVYVEKPASHMLAEGRWMVNAARKYDRVVQVGTQRRSGEDFQAARELAQSGRLGKICMARAWANKVRPDIGRKPVVAPPKDLDFDLWCGPAPNNGYKENLVHYHWHWRWDYGTGECGNLGVHSMDVARWCLGVESPKMIASGGDRYAYDDDKETPDTQTATFDCETAMIHWEHRMWSDRGLEGNQRWGVAIYGTKASLILYSSGWEMYEGDKLVESHDRFDCASAHVENFLDCISSRKQPNADIEIGHRSATFAHLANIALRTRSTITFDGATETIANNAPASDLIRRTYRPTFDIPVTV